MPEQLREIFRAEVLKPIHSRMHAVAQRVRLPLRQHIWQGRRGGWQGTGSGSSIDFHDHRPYYPGDDPRHIDWQAYARTDHYMMKRYREEVSPRVDVVLDGSWSMFFEAEKCTRSLELLYFIVESALQCGISLRAVLLAGHTPYELPVEALQAYQCPPVLDRMASDAAPDLSTINWRYGALRVVISDLLFAGQPQPWLATLSAAQGRGILLVPFCQSEADPAWSGNTIFVDCERQIQRKQQVDAALLHRYQQNYARHFAIWQDACTANGLLLTRIPCHGDFFAALQSEAVAKGAVELCH